MAQVPLPDPRRLWMRVLGHAKGLAIVVYLFSTLFVFNGMQVLSVLLLPVSRRAFRAVNRWGANTWWGQCVVLAHWGYGTRIEVSGDDVPMRESAIVLPNHQQMSDVTFLMYLAWVKGRLGDMKWFVKDVVKWVPGVGWGMLFLDCLFVKRDWTSDRASIEATFRRIIKGKVPLWLMLFPEGTRFAPNKIERSNKIALRRGVKPMTHVLMPRAKGFVASVQGLRDHVDAIYDVTVGYPKGIPTLMQYIKGYSRVAHIHVRRYPIAQMPVEDEALVKWLFARWQEKDALLERFFVDDCFVDGAVS